MFQREESFCIFLLKAVSLQGEKKESILKGYSFFSSNMKGKKVQYEIFTKST